MSLANCSRCGKVFSFVQGGKDVCPVCIKEEEDNYLKVFHFLSTRPGATAQEIAQATEVDIREIYRFVRENRLQLVKVDTGLFCESCGIPITQGKMCEKCVKQLSAEIQNDIDNFKQMHKKNIKKEENNEPKYLKERREKDQRN